MIDLGTISPQKIRNCRGDDIRISVAIITHNEEKNLPGLLAGLDWVDEIVVVDSGSTDRTLSIARAFTDRIWTHVFSDYAAQRNWAINHCRGEWVLSIDADERPTERLRQEVLDRINDPEIAAYRIPIHSTILGHRFRFSGTQDDRPVRLFRRGCGTWFGQVHEQLSVNGRVGKMRGAMDHFTLPDLQGFLMKLNRYTTAEAQIRYESGIPCSGWDLFWRPVREVVRRLIWKKGILDGPKGWLFCTLSSFSTWIVLLKHRELLREQTCNGEEMEADARVFREERVKYRTNERLLSVKGR